MFYLIFWICSTAILFVLTKIMSVNYVIGTLSNIEILFGALIIPSIVVANELRRPKHREFLRKKALYPKIPKEYLHDKPISGSVVFGKDYHTKKIVMAEQKHHVLICGSTGSGKTATALIPSILSCNYESKQIVDIKSRELAYKTADIMNPNTMVIDLNLRQKHVWGWNVFYKLRLDGTDTEQEVLNVIKEVAAIIVPTALTGDAFWSDAARNQFVGLTLYEVCYNGNYEFIDVVKSIMDIPLRKHMEEALTNIPSVSLVRSYLTGLVSVCDETLFSINITLNQCLFDFMSGDIVYFLRDNPNRANPQMLNKAGITQYICVDEHKLDSGYDKIFNIVLKQSLMELQSRTSSGEYPQTMLYWDEWQRLTESCDELRKTTASFLKTGRSKNTSLVLCCQNLDGFKKEQIYDIISNIHYLYVLSSNNSNSLTSEVVCKMAGTYYEKTQNYTEGRGTSLSTSFQEKQVLKPEDLNNLGDDAVLIITNQGYVRTNKEGTAYYKVEPFKSKYEAIIKINREKMKGV